MRILNHSWNDRTLLKVAQPGKDSCFVKTLSCWNILSSHAQAGKKVHQDEVCLALCCGVEVLQF